MGIRFYCPNGHKLNVKAFQAGRNGICPFCGEKMQIPTESTRPSSRQSKSQAGEEPADNGADRETTIHEVGASTATPPDQIPVPSTTSDATEGDPLDEAGNVVWYVRPTSGGQFGPATAEIMRNWLAEGRIAAETLVWREGWRDWREAGGVFPQLAHPVPFPGLEGIPPPAPSIAPIHSPLAPRRTKSRTTPYIYIGALALGVIVLFTILIIVLSNQ